MSWYLWWSNSVGHFMSTGHLHTVFGEKCLTPVCVVCLGVFECVCCVQVHLPVQAVCRGMMLTSGCLSYLLSMVCLRWVSHWAWSFPLPLRIDWLARGPSHPSVCVPLLGLQACTTMLSTGGLSSFLHVCMASTLPIELTLQPSFVHF